MKKYLIKISWPNGTSLTQYFEGDTQDRAFTAATKFAKTKRLGEVSLKIDNGIISVIKTEAWLIGKKSARNLAPPSDSAGKRVPEKIIITIMIFTKSILKTSTIIINAYRMDYIPC